MSSSNTADMKNTDGSARYEWAFRSLSGKTIVVDKTTPWSERDVSALSSKPNMTRFLAGIDNNMAGLQQEISMFCADGDLPVFRGAYRSEIDITGE